MNIGVMTPFLDGHLYGGILLHLNQLASQHGHRLIVVSTPHKVHQYAKALASSFVSGWITIENQPNEHVLQTWAEMKLPVVGINHSSQQYPCVDFDPERGIIQAIEHLIEHGHTKIAFIGNLGNAVTRKRLQTYQAALERNGLDFDPGLVDDIGILAQNGGYRAADRILRGEWQPTAVIASDLCAMAIAERLHEAGLRIPSQLALIGWDGMPQLESANPPITSLHTPVKEMAEQAFHTLLQLIDQKTVAVQQTIFPTELTYRESCGCTTSGSDPQGQLSKIMYAFNRLSVANNINHQIMVYLAHGESEKLKNFSWLNNSLYSWGCLGYWEEPEHSESDNHLKVSHFYSAGHHSLHEEIYCHPNDFPPIHFIPEDAYPSKDYVLTLLPISEEHLDWGVMALLQKIDESFLYFKSHTITYFVNRFHKAIERTDLFHRLQHANHMLETISNATTDVTFDWSIQDRTIQWSHRASVLFGTSPVDTEERFWAQLHPEDRPYVLKALGEHIENGSIFRVECRLKQPDDQYLWVEWNGQISKGKDQQPLRMIGSLRDISERKNAEEQISYLAYHDVLTGLHNRAFIYEYLPKQLSLAASEDRMLGIVLVDLDQFKTVNDKYGHEAGDELLKFVANQMTDAVGSYGTVVRLAGDEFIVILEHVGDIGQVSRVCEKLLSHVRKQFVYRTKSFQISASLGVSLFPKDGLTLDELMKNADSAMYQVKAGGKDRYSFYSIAAL
jgi:diguanylate cyclase (GGDEF)-like protein/PAS domain S-box-containing protein